MLKANRALVSVYDKRGLVEFVRGDDRPTWLGELYYSQVVSLAVFVAAAIWLFMLRKRAAQSPTEPPPADPAPETKA